MDPILCIFFIMVAILIFYLFRLQLVSNYRTKCVHKRDGSYKRLPSLEYMVFKRFWVFKFERFLDKNET